MDYMQFNKTPERKLGEMTAHAILTRFVDPIVYDLCIPDENNTRKLLQILGDRLDGKKLDPEKINYFSHDNKIVSSDLFAGLDGRVGTGIEAAFKFRGFEDISHVPRDNHWSIFEEIFSIEDFTREGLPGYGIFYKYREGKRRQFIKEVNEFFTSKEINEFNRVYDILKPYIGRTNGAK